MLPKFSPCRLTTSPARPLPVAFNTIGGFVPLAPGAVTGVVGAPVSVGVASQQLLTMPTAGSPKTALVHGVPLLSDLST